MKIARESWIIATIGLADLVTTIVFIKHHGAQEANPLFRQFWEMGLFAFILAKLACLIGPIYILEWARGRRTQFVKVASRAVICAYLICYGVGVAHLNGPSAQANELQRNYARGYPSPIMMQAYMMRFAYARHHFAKWGFPGHDMRWINPKKDDLDEIVWHPPVAARNMGWK